VRNIERWQPGKFVHRGSRLRASRDPKAVGTGSWLNADLVASFYHRSLRHYARGRLVDLGCGAVPLYAAYRGLVDAMVCVDWAGSMHGTEHLDVECDLGGALPFEDASFDTIILSDVLEHIPTPETTWREMARILAPGGHLLLNVPFLYWVHEAPHDYHRYTEFALRRLAALAGLEIVLLEPMGGAPEVLADILGKLFARLPLVGPLLARCVQSATGLFVRRGIGRTISKRTAGLFPLGYCMIVEKRR